VKALRAIITFSLLAVSPAYAEEGLHHGTEFVLKRDGALIANFLVLLAGLLWLVFRFLIPALKKRTEDLAASMEQSETARKEAQAKLAELESKMKEFDAQSAKLRSEAVEQGELIKKKIIDDANSVAARIIEKAKSEIDNEAGKAQERLRKEAVDLAAELAEGLLKKNFGEADHRNAVKDYVKAVGAKGGAR
jgi:F-type H+-transporting ATPase subunit b